MKVIITDIFRKKFLDKNKKYFTINDFIKELKKDKILISLKDPIFKIKLKLNLIDFRGTILIIFDDKIVPITLYLKKDKKNGENIIWNKSKKDILNMQEKISIDLEKGDYQVY